jgi:DNA-binding response OmpR family regulator
MKQINIVMIDQDEQSVVKMKQVVKDLRYATITIVKCDYDLLDLMQTDHIDIIIVDVALSTSCDGLQTAKWVQKGHQIPMIVLIENEDDQTLQYVSKIDFFTYIVKPFSQSEIIRAIKLVAYRYELLSSTKRLSLTKHYHYNTQTKTLFHNQQSVFLTKKESQLLFALVQNRNYLVSNEQIDALLWFDTVQSDSNRRQVIFRLRKKVKGLTIETIKDEGYILKI